MVVFRIVCRFYHYKISFLVKCNPKEILIVVMILFNCLWKVRCLEFPLVRHYLLKVILSSHLSIYDFCRECIFRYVILYHFDVYRNHSFFSITVL